MEYNRLFADREEYELVKGWYERRDLRDAPRRAVVSSR